MKLVTNRHATSSSNRAQVRFRVAHVALLALTGCNALSGLGDLHVTEGSGGAESTVSGHGGSGTTTGLGGHGGSAASGGGGGQGGTTTTPASCHVPADCPVSADACDAPACVADACAPSPLPKGTVTAGQTPGDCQLRVCDGEGHTISVADDADVPTVGAECAGDACALGVPVHPPVNAGTPCSEDGGTKCDGNGACVLCIDGSECPSGVCSAGVCADATCTDQYPNGDETAVDCGGSKCPACADGLGCLVAGDCVSLVCGNGGLCMAASCVDGLKNGTESDVDCGGASCAPCASGKACGAHSDCQSEACLGGVCAAIVQIAAGSAHACALLADGTAHCWGANATGQLGDGTTTAHANPRPVQMGALANPTRLSLGNLQNGDSSSAHSCARLTNATVACWGDNSFGQVGIGKLSPSEVKPLAVPGLVNVSTIAAGGRHTCARVSGAVRCWGDNSRGQLGTGDNLQASSPVIMDLSKLNNAQRLAAGSLHTCLSSSANFDSVYCTGANESGQLGLGDTNDRNALDLVSNNMGNGTLLLSAGGTFTCRLAQSGSAQCWGDNTTGQLGTGSSPGVHPSPASVQKLSGASAVVTGTQIDGPTGSHACALLASGGADCWGDNTSGQLGDGTQDGPVTLPAPVPGLQNIAELAAGGSFTCARLKNGPIRCWGRNDLGQLGRGAASAKPGLTPEAIAWP